MRRWDVDLGKPSPVATTPGSRPVLGLVARRGRSELAAADEEHVERLEGRSQDPTECLVEPGGHCCSVAEEGYD